MKALPQDQDQRERFANELDKNFSVVAAAGAGKTTAITDRIVQIAQDRQRACDWLPRLVVVTFTNRAADEMQQRARQRIFEENVSPAVLAAFNRAFFGTIHSFCMKLLAAHGHHLGLPSRLELITDDADLWNDFVQQTQSIGHSLSAENRKALLRHVQLRDLMELGRRGRLPLSLEQREIDCPRAIDLSRVFAHPAAANATRIQAAQTALRDWEAKFKDGADFLPLIECNTGGAFEEKWEAVFREFNEWLSCCALTVAAEVQASYRRFRADRGGVTFDDQIALALELTRNPQAISRIRAKDYIVILDEAQDTDPQQFEILLEIMRPPEAKGRWLEDRSRLAGPRPGHFCMVGDFQQSIFGDRADLKQYQRIHDALIASDAGEDLKFSVTFRLDQSQLDFVNESFRDILNSAAGQVQFIELNPRPSVLPGQVVRLDITAPNPEAKMSDPKKAKLEAPQLAKWIEQTGPDNLRARSWEQVAILCPRKKWFAPIAEALRDVGIDSQIQSETDVQGDSPAHAWFTALLTIMTQPRSGFEIVGVLREVFGISDHDLALFADGHGDRFQIENESSGTDAVSGTINLLARIHGAIADDPLFTAVERIVTGTFLRERLRTLPADDFDGLDTELDVLLESAATAEAEGATLEEFAELLRANFATEREARTPRLGAIQLITSQKAKGLEWDAVIVPFFSRRIHTDDEDFPRIVSLPHEQHAFVAFSKADVPPGKRDALKKAQVLEMERLLYVALTRARHTLVLAADRELFAKANQTAPSVSLTKWFRADHGELNEARVAALETKAIACVETSSYQSLKAQPRGTALQFALSAKPALQPARVRAEQFPRKLLPSSFSPPTQTVEATGADKWKETETEFRATTVPSIATQYGIWWHEFIQQIQWNADPADWDNIFETALPNSPDRNRSAKEWKILQQNISSLTEFAPGICESSAITRVEMPFLWGINDRRCLEGVVDLAQFDAGKKKCFILDWKTNQITPDKIDRLRDHYRPQLAAYWKAVSEIAKLEVEATIYSTAAGALVRYKPDELAREWARLEKLPADQFDIEVAEELPRMSTASTKSEQLEFADLSNPARRG
ncbi:MAG TPA: UvrD-helicase domain-containing protein [Chthoniobacterales bacterium]|nr:UvrD-helicase domain-containing protein [Chthoniobacterales bacterium]